MTFLQLKLSTQSLVGREEKLLGATHRKRKAGSQAWRSSLGAWSSTHLSDTPALGSNSGKMSPLAGLKSGGAYWRAVRNQDSALKCACACTDLTYSHPQPHLPPCSSTVEGQQTRNSLVFWLACQHTPWPALGPCSSSSCSGTALHYSKGCHCQQRAHTQREQRCTDPLTRAETVIASVHIPAHNWREEN